MAGPASGIVTGLVGTLTGAVLTAILNVLGLMLLLVVSAWGLVHVYALLVGKDSEWVFYQIGRVFGEEIYENEYAAYVAKRHQSERQASFRERYDRGGD